MDMDAVLPWEAEHQRMGWPYRARFACLAAAGGIAMVVLWAWLVPAVGSMLPDAWSLMKANTALCMLLSVAALALVQPGQGSRRRAIGLIGVSVVLFLAGSALLGHANGRSYWTDTLLAADSGSDMPGRMSVQTSLFFIIIGIAAALVGTARRLGRQVRDVLNIALIGLVLVLAAAYLFHASALFGQSATTRTSPHTLACMVLLVVALSIGNTRSGALALFAGVDIGSRVARLTLPFALFFPFLVIGGFYALTGAGWLSVPYALAWTTSAMSVLLFVLIVIMGWRINDATSSLADEEQRNRLLLESAGEGIYGLGSDGRTTFANAAACAMLGYGVDELVGRTTHDLIHHHYADGTFYPAKKCPIYSSLREGSVHRVDDEVFWRKDGSSLPVQYTSTPIFKNGKPVGAVVVFTDVSERNKVARMKDEFISTVSHELRTPLTSIKGAMGLVVGGKLGELPEQPMQMAKMALENCNRLELLVNDLLDFSKFRYADKALRMQPIRCNDLVDKTVHSNQGYADKYGIVLQWRPAGCGDVYFQGDENRLIQVLSNLLSNAIKHTPKEGRVVVSASRDDQWARVSVTDNGPGISPGFQDQVFEKFSQADSSDTRRLGGTGLGLAISKEIIAAHKGRIGFDSEPGQGTTFYFELPIMQSSKPATETPGG